MRNSELWIDKNIQFITVQSHYKATPKSNTTLNNNYHYGVKMITTIENNLWKQPTSLQRSSFMSKYGLCREIPLYYKMEGWLNQFLRTTYLTRVVGGVSEELVESHVLLETADFLHLQALILEDTVIKGKVNCIANKLSKNLMH